ncbi:MAG: PKD domain-containing protein [Bacteroidota bacterium]
MERRYRSCRAVALALALAVLGTASTSSAQYMYLDADGDGVHTAADVVPTTGSVTFDVWLKTDTNRDGSRAVCAQDTTASFTINSYTVILRATNGSMSWTLTNRMSAFTLRFESGSTSFELWDGWGSGTILPAGTYRLATVTATPTGGTPSIAILPTTQSDPYAITSFGCRCDGIDLDNTLKLGNDWSDWDGLAYAGVTNYNPVLTQPSPMGVVEGQVADQDLHATDAEGEPITFSAIGAPSYMTLTDSGGGTGHVRLAPGYSDAGSANVTIRASDPVGFDEKNLYIRVDNGNRPPVLDPIADMTVAPGDTASQVVTAHDPDGDLLGFHKVTLIPWVALLPLDTGSAKVVVTPPDTVGGIFSVTMSVTDASLMDQKTFSVIVPGTAHAPAITSSISPVEVAEGGFESRTVDATDPDGIETLRFFMQAGPAFVTVGEPYFFPWGWAETYIWIRPHAGDRGDYVATIAVTDGTTTVTTPLAIQVTNGYPGDTSAFISGAPGNPLLDGESWRAAAEYVGGSAQFMVNVSASLQSGGAVAYSFAGGEPPQDIELLSRRDQRSNCATMHGGTVLFSPPTGDSLRVGSYTGATRDADGSHPGLDITVGCARAASVSGRFDVKELVVRYGFVQSLRITFQAYVNGSPAPITGEVRYKVRSLPVSVYAPARRLVGVGDDVSMTVSAADSSGRTVALTCDVPSGGVFRPSTYQPNTADFSWRPGFDQVGTTRVYFRGRNTAGDTASAFCDITVQPRNAVSAPLGANNVLLITSNRGAFGYDLRDSTAGLTTNFLGVGEPAASSAGLWIGALVDGQPRVAVGGRTPEFVPGPAPAGQAQPFDPRYKNYKLVRGGIDAIDWREWPITQGAPTEAGQPALAGDEMAWSVYNDADPTAHRAPNGRTAPLGVEVRQTTWAYSHVGPLANTVFVKYLIRNAGPHTLTNAYASIWVDPYAGRGTWNGIDSVVTFPFNDRVGCDSSRAMAYAYGSMNAPFPSPDVALGVSLLHGAVQHPGAPDSIPLGLASVRRLTAQPATAAGLYEVMQGLQENGTPLLDPAGQPARFEVTGDPVAHTGWLDTLSTSSRVFVLSTGPFTMAPGDSQTIVAALVANAGNDRLALVTDLRTSMDAIRSATPIANTPPVLDYQARTYTFNEGDDIAFSINGYDNERDRLAYTATELPTGATLTGEGAFSWKIGYDQAGTHLAHIIATDTFGAWDSTTIVFTIRDVNRAPVARSGGPYRGVAGTALEFDGSASSDPDGDPVMTTWTFGDGTTADGGHVLHTYAAPGLYTVVLLAMDRALDDRDTTTASIAAPIQVRAFVPSGGGLIRLASPAPKVEICLEIVSGVVSLPDLQSTSFALESHGTGSVSSILAIDTDASIGGDRDGNGIPELSLAFRKSDLRALFGGLPQGRTNVSAFLTGVAGKNTAVAAPVTLTIEASHEPLAVLLVPNPINPRGVLTFTTTRAGWARIALFDVRGRLVRRLFEAKTVAAGYHDVPIDGMDDGGRPLASGLYFFRIDAAEGTRSGRLTVLK